jgi:hypothetical protein
MPLLLQLKLFKKDIYKNMEHLFLTSIFLCLSVGVEHFWMDGKHVFTNSQCRSSRYMWSVRDLDLESMINFSTRAQGLTKLNTMTSNICRRFLYPIYGSGGILLTPMERCNYSFYLLK